MNLVMCHHCLMSDVLVILIMASRQHCNWYDAKMIFKLVQKSAAS